MVERVNGEGDPKRSRSGRRSAAALVGGRRGLSLIELLVVVVIIAVLAAVAVPVYRSTEQTARDRVDEANVKILDSATLQWVLADEGNDPRRETTATLKPKLAPYLTDWPVSPNGKAYALDGGQWRTD